MTLLASAFHAIKAMGCTIGILGVLLLCVWRCLDVFKQGTHYIRQLHSIPCSQCVYFTGDYRLKCTVHPMTALTEEAIGCYDYEPTIKQPDCRRRGCSTWQASPTHYAKDLIKR